MKHPILNSTAAAAFAFLLATSLSGLSQAVTHEKVVTTSSTGTISEFGPETIVVKSASEAGPGRYYYSKTTTYVDEQGAPVAVGQVKSGLPVTVYYVKEGERMLVSKVIVRKMGDAPVVPAVPVIEEKTTTTTTTTDSGK